MSWTLKVGPVGEHFCRLLAHMDTHGHTVCNPEFDNPGMVTRPFVKSSAGYLQRSIQQFPRQGADGPWQISNDYRTNVKTFRHGPVADESLRFGSALGSSPMGAVAAGISG